MLGGLTACQLGFAASPASARYDERDDFAQVQPILDQINAYINSHPSFTFTDVVRERDRSDDGEIVKGYLNLSSHVAIFNSKCWYPYKGERHSCSYKQQISNGVSSFTVAKRNKRTGKVHKCWKSRSASGAFPSKFIDPDPDKTYFGLNRALVSREIGAPGTLKLYIEDGKRQFRVFFVNYDPATFALKGWESSEFYLRTGSVKADPKIDFFHGQYFGYIRRVTKRTITQWGATQPALFSTKPKC